MFCAIALGALWCPLGVVHFLVCATRVLQWGSKKLQKHVNKNKWGKSLNEKRENILKQQTTKRKERADNKHRSEQGAGPKGHQTKQHLNPEDHETHTKNIQIPKEHLTNKTNTEHTESQGNCHSRVAGPMGRPALLGSRPRGPQYRGVQVPPHCGNRPRWRKNKHRPRQRTITPKDVDPALSRSQWTVCYQTQCRHRGTHSSRSHPDKKQPKFPDNILNRRNAVGPLPRGRPRGGGWAKDSPSTFRSQSNF